MGSASGAQRPVAPMLVAGGTALNAAICILWRDHASCSLGVAYSSCSPSSVSPSPAPSAESPAVAWSRSPLSLLTSRASAEAALKRLYLKSIEKGEATM